jgi:DNA-binding SARP family transcriptional activator
MDDPMHALTEVRLLGPAMVRTAAGVQVRHDQWKTQKNRDLLRLLAVEHGTVVPVDRVVEALWPKATVDKGRTSLRTAMAHLRRVVGPDVVERVGDGLRLGPAWVDLAVYQS